MTTTPDTPMQAPEPIWLKVGEAARIANISEATLRRLLYTKKIPSVKIGRLLRVRREAVLDYLHKLEAA